MIIYVWTHEFYTPDHMTSVAVNKSSYDHEHNKIK